MKTFTSIFKLGSIFAISFLLMTIELIGQREVPPSDLEFQGSEKTEYVPSSEQSNPLMMTESAMTTMIGLPPQISTYSNRTRGYWFTSPSNITITGLHVPDDASSATQNIEIIRFNSAPPHYSGTTNDFVSLGRWINVAGSTTIACNITVSSGDMIGILGDRGGVNSYGTGPHNTTINGNSVVLNRMGMQYLLSSAPAHSIWQEPTHPIGRVEIYYDSTYSVPLSNWPIYLGILLIGVFIIFRVRRKLA